MNKVHTANGGIIDLESWLEPGGATFLRLKYGWLIEPVSDPVCKLCTAAKPEVK